MTSVVDASNSRAGGPRGRGPIGWGPIIGVLLAALAVATLVSLFAQFATGFMVEDFCYSVLDQPGAWRPAANPYPVRWFSFPVECYDARTGALLVASNSGLAWKLFISTVVVPTLIGLVVAAVGFRLISSSRQASR